MLSLPTKDYIEIFFSVRVSWPGSPTLLVPQSATESTSTYGSVVTEACDEDELTLRQPCSPYLAAVVTFKTHGI